MYQEPHSIKNMGQAGMRCFFFPEVVAKETYGNWTWPARWSRAIRPAMGKYQWFLHTPASIAPIVSPGYKDHTKDFFFLDAEHGQRNTKPSIYGTGRVHTDLKNEVTVLVQIPTTLYNKIKVFKPSFLDGTLRHFFFCFWNLSPRPIKMLAIRCSRIRKPNVNIIVIGWWTKRN